MHDTPHPLKVLYYFCRDSGSDARPNVPTFIITPKEYFDRRGFLLDTSSFDPKIPDFQRVADSTFEYVGKSDPEKILLGHGAFMWRDMLTEIKYTYHRRRLLGIDDQF